MNFKKTRIELDIKNTNMNHSNDIKEDSITGFSVLPLSFKIRLLKKRHEHCFKIFTSREKEIILLIANGYSSHKISALLFISKHTVDTHRKNIYRKGDFKTIRDVVLFSLVYDLN